MSEHDLAPHTSMWHKFIKLVVSSAAGSAIVLILMAIFLL